MKLILGLLAILAVCLAMLGVIASKHEAAVAPIKAAQRQAAAANVADVIKDAQEKGLITRFEPEQRRAYVPPTTWARLDAKAKEELTLWLAVTCAEHQGTPCRPFVVYDALSARELAGIRAGRFVVK